MGPNRFSLPDFGATPAGRHIRRPPADPRKLPPRSAPRNAAYRRHHPNPILRIPRWARLATTCTVALALVAGGITTAALTRLSTNIDRAEVTALAEAGGSHEPLDILVIGSDERAADSTENAAGKRSDSMVLAHLSADDDWIDGLQIPRDTMVDAPECTDPDTGRTFSGGTTMVNGLLGYGADDALQEDARSEDTSGAGTDSTDSTAEATDGAGASGASATPEVDLAVRTADGALCG
ncbi:hypothetical protein [Brevibacterium samyangense]|uniref:LytR family transcriptional regulator n=1 Tax=Brevibacterium samyangense TaxID=366888 RepID=A0ABP5ENR8_9MICO